MNQQQIRYFIPQMRKVYNAEDKTVGECLSLVRQMYDVKKKADCLSLIATGFASILLEIIFKINIIDDNARLEAFYFYRDLIEQEYQNADRQLRKSDDQLESQRLIKILPKEICDLFLDDQDENIIFESISREWNTPSLVWSKMMMREILLIYIEYNNQVVKKPNNDYGQIFPINSPLFPDIRNETFVQNLMLKEFNLQPNWQTDEGLIVFLNELVESINQALKLYLEGHFDNSEQSTKKFYRLSCKLLTQLTAFQLSLEQFFFNSKHPEFENEMKLLEDYNENQLQTLLQQQRDTIPTYIVKNVQSWLELIIVDHINIQPPIRSCIIQIFYILSQSQVALVYLDEIDIISKAFNLTFKVLNSQLHKYDKFLSLVSLSDILSHSNFISRLDNKHFAILLQIYEIVQKQDKMLLDAFKNIIARIYTDPSTTKDFNQYLIQKNVSLKTRDLDILQNKDFIVYKIWREEFDEKYQIPLYEDLPNNPQKLPIFPIISKLSLDPLPNMPEILQNRQNMIEKQYEDYLQNIQTGKIIDVNMTLNSVYEPQTEQISLRQSTIVKEQSDELLIGEFEIFS